jgi:RimJ/RimL family protein N-acetyltransferase
MKVYLMSDRLILREFTDDDLAALIALNGDPRVMKYLTAACWRLFPSKWRTQPVWSHFVRRSSGSSAGSTLTPSPVILNQQNEPIGEPGAFCRAKRNPSTDDNCRP